MTAISETGWRSRRISLDRPYLAEHADRPLAVTRAFDLRFALWRAKRPQSAVCPRAGRHSVIPLPAIGTTKGREIEDMAVGIFKVIAEFTDSAGNPLSGDDYSVALLDEDKFFDDKLGESSLSPEGVADFIVSAADILSFDSAGERTPDLYFIVRKNGSEIFRSEVFDEVDFEVPDPVTGRPKGLTRKFGPFQVVTS